MEEMEGRRIILADGTTLEDGEAGFASGYLWIWITGMTLPEAAGIFFEPAKTERIRFQYGEMQDVYEGYTACIHLSTTEGRLSVCLTKGGND